MCSHYRHEQRVYGLGLHDGRTPPSQDDEVFNRADVVR